METKVKMVSLSDLFDGVCGGASMADVSQTIAGGLSKAEMERYLEATNKVARGKVLNRKDLEVFDKTDALTYEQNGMCLKDSQVTKARLKACKKYGVVFNDRDGLVEHMNVALSATQSFAEQGPSKCADDEFYAILYYVIKKAESGELLDLRELQFLSDIEQITNEELGFSFLNDELVDVVNASSKACGVYFKNLQSIVH